MNTIHEITFKGQKMLTLTALGVVALAPLFGAASVAQADPPDHAPAWGWRKGKGNNGKGNSDDRGRRGRSRGNDRNRDDDRYGGGYNGGGYNSGTTVEGVVTNDRSGNDFDVRLSTGQVVRVRDNSGEPERLSVGDRVYARGTWDRGVFQATNVRITSNVGGWPGYGGRPGSGGGYGGTTVEGVVTNDRSGNDFDVRLSTGQVVRVRDNSGESERLSVGNRVYARGTWDRGVFQATSVRITRDSNGGGWPGSGGGYNSGTRVDGVVTNDRSGNDFDVRLSTGQVVRVRDNSGKPESLSVGDHVIANGTWRSGIFQATNVRITRDRSGLPGYGGYNGQPGYDDTVGRAVNFPGIVVERSLRTRVLRVRGDNGTTYVVRTQNAASFGVNERVRIIGTASNGVVTATSVTRL